MQEALEHRGRGTKGVPPKTGFDVFGALGVTNRGRTEEGQSTFFGGTGHRCHAPLTTYSVGSASDFDVNGAYGEFVAGGALSLIFGGIADDFFEATWRTAGSRGFTVGSKIKGQMESRGWTREMIDDAIMNPVKTETKRDTRNLGNGLRMDDPATVYYSSQGGHVVRNDVTNDIVQVSNRHDPNWK